jgi:hypothetical protein
MQAIRGSETEEVLRVGNCSGFFNLDAFAFDSHGYRKIEDRKPIATDSIFRTGVPNREFDYRKGDGFSDRSAIRAIALCFSILPDSAQRPSTIRRAGLMSGLRRPPGKPLCFRSCRDETHANEGAFP